MTREEKIIATAFTGTMFIEGSDMGLLYEYMEKKVGHGVIDIMLADKAFWEELHRACEQDFIDMVSKEQPSLPSNLDEAVFAYEDSSEYPPANQEEDRMVYDAFKAGAEWQHNEDERKHCFAKLLDIKQAYLKLKEVNPYIVNQPAACFLRGAEWMAGQGVKATASVGYFNQCGLSILTEPSIEKLGLEEGDEVEIIIRKKQ